MPTVGGGPAAGMPQVGGPTVGAPAGGGPMVGGQLAGALRSGDVGSASVEMAAVGAEAGVNGAVSAVASPVVGKVAGMAAGKAVRSKAGRYTLAAAAVLALLSVLANWFLIAMTTMSVTSAFAMLTTSGAAQEEAQAGCYGGPAGSGAAGALTDEQKANADAIISTLIADGAQPADVVIAVMVAMTESSLINVDHGDKAGPDSRGLFQQRDSWGTLTERMDPPTATRLFYARLKNVDRALLSPWVAGQRVQISAFADGSNYHKNYAIAVEIVTPRFEPWLMMSAQTAKWLNWVGGPSSPTTDVVTVTPPNLVTNYCEGAGGISNGGSAGAWGGHSNGLIPDGVLCPIEFNVAQFARCDAMMALVELNGAFTVQFGRGISITDSYRTFAQQVQVKKDKGSLAATPGFSNHGWGLALDLDLAPGATASFTTPMYLWMAANAPSFGWINPDWAKPGPKWTKNEPWHWEFVGALPPTEGAS